MHAVTRAQVEAIVGRWRARFGGGMLPFDEAYREARRRGRVIAEAQRDGVEAVLRDVLDRESDE